MGKYEEVLKDLLRLPTEDKNRQYQLDQIKKLLARQAEEEAEGEVDNKTIDLQETPGFEIRLNGKEPQDLARLYRDLRAYKTAFEERESKLNLVIEAVAQMIEMVYESQGISSLKLTDGGSVSSQPEPCGVVKDKEAFRKWCLENGYEHSMTLPYQTMNSLVKEMLLEGQELPAGIEAFFRPKLVLRSK